SANTPNSAAAAAGPGKLPTATDAAGFVVTIDACKRLPSIFPKDGWLPALAQQYLAEAAVNALTRRLADSGPKDLKLACTGSQPTVSKACGAAKAFDGIA